MPVKHLAIFCIAITLLAWGCSKKYVPEQSAAVTTGTKNTATAAAAEKKVVVKPVVKKAPAPKVIVVNDNAAKKSFDGRLYYDLEGRRYWRNNIDGKYYLFNKSMYADSAFKPH